MKEGGADGGKREGNGEHSPSTIFVSGLTDSITDAQFEETFSEVGPVKHSFVVRHKGVHSGIGYVRFVATGDANLAAELKNGTSLGGKKIAVKLAKYRAPRGQRRLKTDRVNADVSKRKDDKEEITIKDVKDEKISDSHEIEEVNRTGKALVTSLADKEQSSKEVQGTIEALVSPKSLCKNGKSSGEVPPNIVATKGESSSEKQRVARTVIFGGLTNADIAEEVISRAKEVGNVCSVMYPLPEQKLEHHALTRDGCTMDAAAVIYRGVKSAHVAVSKLHQQEIKGASVWARQLGGEGSKTAKWKLIVRNISYKAKFNEIKELFSSAGFVWKVLIPQAPETGPSKGFAFVTFTCKQDAESNP
ncbi:hypothetical protein C5167_012071 [Papaver somniferum]|uniref:RRM domain-containing protein n=1 Tax=Papaver somniferum TaxID=3469 RepID=A0A4Y7IYF6_PAPSO|nr:hypothetical protein C5167_012071 [Papaver somniferum]